MTLRCTVLSADFVPKSFITAEEALVDIMLKKSWMLEAHPDKFIRSVSLSFPAPKTVVIYRFISLPAHFYGAAILSPQNLKLRDEGTCQYCARRGAELRPNEFWTRDHIFPRSRGGEDLWQNVVLACSTCNNRKGDMTPDEADMKLINTPRQPTRWMLEARKRRTHYWEDK